MLPPMNCGDPGLKRLCMAAGMLQELDAAISQRLPGGLSLQVSEYFMDLEPLDDSFLLGEGLISEGILLDEDDGLLGLGLTATEAAFQHDYQMLNSKTASLQQQRGLLRASPETHTISGARQLPAPSSCGICLSRSFVLQIGVQAPWIFKEDICFHACKGILEYVSGRADEWYTSGRWLKSLGSELFS